MKHTGRPIINPEAYYGSRDTIAITPGPGGAHNWSPMSFNPATGLVYIPASTTGSFSFAVDPNSNSNQALQNMGIDAFVRPSGCGDRTRVPPSSPPHDRPEPPPRVSAARWSPGTR